MNRQVFEIEKNSRVSHGYARQGLGRSWWALGVLDHAITVGAKSVQ